VTLCEISLPIIIIIIIINDIYKAQTSPTQQMRQVSHCTITVILEQEHFHVFEYTHRLNDKLIQYEIL